MAIRHLTSADVARIIPLMAELGYPTTPSALAERLDALNSNPEDAVLVAEEGLEIVGLVAVHSFAMLHRPGRLGRITALVVASDARGRGVGAQLLSAAENHLRLQGCVLLEVTSAEQRADAHAFYLARGYREKRVRFIKSSGT
jgi:ribosomal protein S18 acetylase RimI-like enzyme